jgi:hypothetical protein
VRAVGLWIWWSSRQKPEAQDNTEATNSAVASVAGATKAYRGFRYSFDGRVLEKRANEQEDGMHEPTTWSFGVTTSTTPLNLFSKEEKTKRLLTEAQICEVAQ